jgi:hypothetical protein
MNKNELKQPFFAQFLESQKAEDKQAHLTTISKDTAHTLKYPSDGDDNPPDIS